MTVKELLEKLPEARFEINKQINHKNGTVEKLNLAYCPNKKCVLAEGWFFGFGNWKVLAYGVKEYKKDRPDDPDYDLYEICIKRK